MNSLFGPTDIPNLLSTLKSWLHIMLTLISAILAVASLWKRSNRRQEQVAMAYSLLLPATATTESNFTIATVFMWLSVLFVAAAGTMTFRIAHNGRLLWLKGLSGTVCLAATLGLLYACQPIASSLWNWFWFEIHDFREAWRVTSVSLLIVTTFLGWIGWREFFCLDLRRPIRTPPWLFFIRKLMTSLVIFVTTECIIHFKFVPAVAAWTCPALAAFIVTPLVERSHRNHNNQLCNQ